MPISQQNLELAVVALIVVAIVAYYVIKRKKSDAPSQPAAPAPVPVAPPASVTAPPPVVAPPVAPPAAVDGNASPPTHGITANGPATVFTNNTISNANPPAPAPATLPVSDGDVMPPGASVIPTSPVANAMTTAEQQAMAMLGHSTDSAKLEQAIAASMAARGVSQEQIRAAMNSFGGTGGANGGAQQAIVRAQYGANLGDAFANTPFAGYFKNPAP